MNLIHPHFGLFDMGPQFFSFLFRGICSTGSYRTQISPQKVSLPSLSYKTCEWGPRSHSDIVWKWLNFPRHCWHHEAAISWIYIEHWWYTVEGNSVLRWLHDWVVRYQNNDSMICSAVRQSWEVWSLNMLWGSERSFIDYSDKIKERRREQEKTDNRIKQ